MDLCRCLCQEWDVASTLLTHKTDPCPALVGKRVLELGCGHGLPGIIPLLAGAQVHFQVRRDCSLAPAACRCLHAGRCPCAMWGEKSMQV